MVGARKGIRSRLRNRLWGVGGDGSEPGEAGACSGERFLFWVTGWLGLGSRLTGEGVQWLGRAAALVAVWGACDGP